MQGAQPITPLHGVFNNEVVRSTKARNSPLTAASKALRLPKESQDKELNIACITSLEGQRLARRCYWAAIPLSASVGGVLGINPKSYVTIYYLIPT
jgi:hypothetical protein